MEDSKRVKYLIWGCVAGAVLSLILMVSTCQAQTNGNFGRVRLVPKSTVNSQDERNGVMMYNDTLNKFRFYQNNAWVSLDGFDTLTANVLTVDSLDARHITADTITSVYIQGNTIQGNQLFLYNNAVPTPVTDDGAFSYSDDTKTTYISRYGFFHNLFPARTTDVLKYNGLGSTTKAESKPVNEVESSRDLVNQRLELISIYLYAGDTINGVKWFNTVAGNYTATDSNQVALYSYNAGTLTREAVSVSADNLWSSLGPVSKNFFQPYSVEYDGVYFIGLIYNRSAEVTPPTLAASGSLTAINQTLTNSAKLYATLAAQTTAPGSTTGAAISLALQCIWVGVY